MSASFVVQTQVRLPGLALPNADADRAAPGLAAAQRHRGRPRTGSWLAGQRLPRVTAPIEDFHAAYRGLSLEAIHEGVAERGRPPEPDGQIKIVDVDLAHTVPQEAGDQASAGGRSAQRVGGFQA